MGKYIEKIKAGMALCSSFITLFEFILKFWDNS